MDKNPIKFGTDGWRAIIAEDFTFENVRICAQAVASYLKDNKLTPGGLVIGYDTRFASEDFARAAAEVVAANGIRVYLTTRATPTPVVSYGVIARKASGAIIITASHNPAEWNGFKIKTAGGASAPTKVITQVEDNIAQLFSRRRVRRMPLDEAKSQGLVEDVDLAPVYLEHIGKLIDLNRLKRASIRVVIDDMYGAGIGYLSTLLGGGNLKTVEINGERNPTFPGIQPEPIAANLARLSDTVMKQRANVGLATDGDADRLGIIDESGLFLTQHQVFALLCLYFLEIRGERSSIVKTLTSTDMLYRLGEMYNVPIYETEVGFKYVAPIMINENSMIGGEESGGYGFHDHIPERDGILAGLYFLDLMIKTGKTPSELVAYLYSKVGTHHYNRIDVHFPAEQREAITKRINDQPPEAIAGVKVSRIDTRDGSRYMMQDGSWLLIRFSGTEPVLRIYAENGSLDRVKELLEAGRKIAGV
jgi:alpha-D-glucose phosphate-specific phosphoglucomutase